MLQDNLETHSAVPEDVSSPVAAKVEAPLSQEKDPIGETLKFGKGVCDYLMKHEEVKKDSELLGLVTGVNEVINIVQSQLPFLVAGSDSREILTDFNKFKIERRVDSSIVVRVILKGQARGHGLEDRDTGIVSIDREQIRVQDLMVFSYDPKGSDQGGGGRVEHGGDMLIRKSLEKPLNPDAPDAWVVEANLKFDEEKRITPVVSQITTRRSPIKLYFDGRIDKPTLIVKRELTKEETKTVTH